MPCAVNVWIHVTRSYLKLRLPSVKLVPVFTRNGPNGRYVPPNVRVVFHDVTNTTIAVPNQLSKRWPVARTSGHCGQHGRHVHPHVPEIVFDGKSTIAVPSQSSKKKSVELVVPISCGHPGPYARNNVKVVSVHAHVATHAMPLLKKKVANVAKHLTMDSGQRGPSVMMRKLVNLSCAMAV